MFDWIGIQGSNLPTILAITIVGDGSPQWSLPRDVASRTLQLDMNAKRQRGFWAMQLDNAVRAVNEPMVFVAEGLACLAIARWAQLSPPRYLENIAGAILFNPLTFQLGQAVHFKDLYPGPAVRLPFASAVVDSRLSMQIARVLELADVWGSALIEADSLSVDWRTGRSTPSIAGIAVNDAAVQQSTGQAHSPAR